MTDIAGQSALERWDGLLPGDHQLSTLATFDFDPTNAGHERFRRASQFVLDNWEGDQFVGLLLHGEPGTGKTHAAIALAMALRDAGADVFYRYVPELGMQEANVSGWTAPRLAESVYASGRPTSTTIIKEEAVEGDAKTTTTTTRMAIEDEGKVRFKRDPHSVFPSFIDEGIPRNPKTVLILDDYKPSRREQVRAAIEAASNAGALVIMTSNFGDILSLAAPGERDITQRRVEYGAPEVEKEAVRAAIAHESRVLAGAFMSRLVAGFLEIEFTGADHRKLGSFWTGMLDPKDFIGPSE